MRIAARNRRPGQDPIPPRARFWARVFVLVPILAFLVLATIQVVKLLRAVNRDLGSIVASVLHQTLGHEFKIGPIYNAPGIVRIDGVMVSSKPTWKESHGEIGLNVQRVIIRYDFPGLISDLQNATHYVQSITLDHPTALVERYSQKRFNFTDLITTKPRQHAKPFVAKITVIEGTLFFRDYTAPLDPAGKAAMNAAYRLNGDVDCNSNELVTFVANGIGAGRFEAASVIGQVSRRKPLQYHITGNVSNGDATYWTRYLRLVPQARVLGGRADVKFSLLVPPTPVATLTATAAAPKAAGLVVIGDGVVRNGAVRWLDRTYLDQPIEAIAGRFSFTNSEVIASGSALLAGQRIGITGTIGLPPPSTTTTKQMAMTPALPTAKPPAPPPTVKPIPPTLSLNLEGRSFDLARFSTAFPHLKIPTGVSISPTSAHVLLQGPATDPVAQGDVEVGSIGYAGNQVTNIRAKIEYAHRILGVQSANFGVNGTGQANVSAAVDLSHPKLTYTASGHVTGVEVAGLRIPKIPAVRTPSGNVAPASVSGLLAADFIAQDTGTGSRIASNVDVVDGRVSRTPIRSLRGRIVFNEHRSVDFDKVAIEAAGGRALVSGSVALNTPSPKIALSVNAEGIAIRQALAPYSNIDAGGVGYFNGLVAGTVDNPTATGTVHLFRAHYGRYDADVVHGDLTASRNALRIYDLHIHRYPAEADVAGTITDLTSGNPRLALKATMQGAQLDDISELLGQTGREKAASLLPKGASPRKVESAFSGLEGEVNGNFDIGGRVQQPSVVGHVDMKDITAGGNHIDTAQADVSVTGQQVRLRRVVLRSGKATATGDLAWWPQTGKIQAVAAGSDIELYRFRTFYGPYADLRGSFDFSGSLAGTIKSPTVTFGVVASDLSIDGQHLAQFTGFGRYANGVLTSDAGPWEFTLLVPVVNPTSNAPQTEQITYSIDSFQLSLPSTEAAAAAHKPEPRLNMTAHIPTDAPEHLSHIVDTLRNSKFAQTPAVKKIVAEYDQLPRPTEATIAVPQLTVTGPLSSLSAKGTLAVQNAVSGSTRVAAVDADLSYTGGPKPSAAASVTANDLVIDGVPVTSVVLNGTFANRVITVPNFRATQGGAFVQASGTADLDGKMVADVDVSNVPLSMFNSLIPHSRVLSGKISTLSATLSGRTRSPDVQASISIANPELALRPPATEPVVAAPASKTDGKGAKTAAAEPAGPTYKLDEIRSGTITVASPTPGGSKILTVNDLTAFRDGRPVATFSGSMPFRWTNIDATMAQLPTDEPLHAKLVVNDLSILALALPSIDPSRTGGVLTATVDANDPRLATPVAGSVTVSGASLGILGVDTYLKKIDANITFDQAHAVVNSFSGASNIKGNFAVSGGVDFRGSDNLNLKLALNALQFNEHTRQSLLNRLYSSAAQGKITGALAISGPFKSPLLANSKTAPLVLSEANFGIPSPQEQAGGAKPVYSVDPRFNVYAAIGAAGKSVTVKNALLNADVAGTAHVAGSMSDPRFDSILTVNRGRFVIPPATVLRLDRGGTVALHYPTLNTDTTPGAEPYIMSEQVSLTAETNVSASPAQLSQSASAISGALSGGPSSASLASLDTQRTEYHITVDAEGSLNDTSKLNMTYTSDPPLEKSQILALLSQQSAILGILRGGAGSGDVVAQELSSIVNSVGVGMLLNPVETNLAQALGLSSFVVDYSPDAPVVVTLTKPLGHRLEASFQRSFGARAPSVVNSLITNPQYQLKLSYSLSRRLRLSVSTDDQQNNTVAIEGVIGF